MKFNFLACVITVEYKFYLSNKSANRSSCCKYIDLNSSQRNANLRTIYIDVSMSRIKDRCLYMAQTADPTSIINFVT